MMQKQGSALITICIGMLLMMTLGTIILHAAHAWRTLAHERLLQRPLQITLESVLSYAALSCGKQWLQKAEQGRVHEKYTLMLNAIPYTITVTSQSAQQLYITASCEQPTNTYSLQAQVVMTDGRVMVYARKSF